MTEGAVHNEDFKNSVEKEFRKKTKKHFCTKISQIFLSDVIYISLT